MPTSTAATTTLASSPVLRPASFSGTRNGPFGRISVGSGISTAKRARLLVDREPLQADGAARHAARRLVERTAQRRDHVGAGAPVAADGERNARGPGLHVGRRGGEQLVADDVERDLAGGARGHRDRHGVAGRVFGLVEGDLEQVRRVGGGIRVEARVERDRRRRNAAIVARDIEPVAAPGHRQRRYGPVCRRPHRCGRQPSGACS